MPLMTCMYKYNLVLSCLYLLQQTTIHGNLHRNAGKTVQGSEHLDHCLHMQSPSPAKNPRTVETGHSARSSAAGGAGATAPAAISLVTEQGLSLLHLTCSLGYDWAARMLLRRGANINLQVSSQHLAPVAPVASENAVGVWRRDSGQPFWYVQVHAGHTTLLCSVPNGTDWLVCRIVAERLLSRVVCTTLMVCTT